MRLEEQMNRQGIWLFRWRSYLPLLIIPFCGIILSQSGYYERTFGASIQNVWEILCIGISFTGLVVRCLTVGFVPRGTSGRNTREQVASTLNTTGMYSIVRNPLYGGNFLIIFGLLCFTTVWWFIIIGVLLFLLFYERIILTEEKFLEGKFGETFNTWAAKTPALFPHFSHWQRTRLPFSFKTVLRREHSTFFAIVASFTALANVQELYLKRAFAFTPAWIIFFTVGLVVYLALRVLKKKTRLLNVSGR